MNTISDWNVVITLPVWQSNGFAEGAFCADAPTTLTIQEQREPEWNGTMKYWEIKKRPNELF